MADQARTVESLAAEHGIDLDHYWHDLPERIILARTDHVAILCAGVHLDCAHENLHDQGVPEDEITTVRLIDEATGYLQGEDVDRCQYCIEHAEDMAWYAARAAGVPIFQDPEEYWAHMDALAEHDA